MINIFFYPDSFLHRCRWGYQKHLWREIGDDQESRKKSSSRVMVVIRVFDEVVVCSTYLLPISSFYSFILFFHSISLFTFPVHLFYQLYMQETGNLNITSLVNRSFPVLLLLKKCSFRQKKYVFSKICPPIERFQSENSFLQGLT